MLRVARENLQGEKVMPVKKALYLTMIIEPNDDGYLARCPGIQGAFAKGDAIEQAMFNCVDVVKVIAAYRAERGETMSTRGGFDS
jgi:predicted RNase H-like HicB family nuclease